MKMNNADFERMRDYCARIMARDTWAAVVADYSARGLSDKQLRWDVLHASKFPITPLYSYLNDDLIDTALRAIVKVQS